ncbi:MAG: cell division protein ZapA [Proteobacteria bacterium]|nr:cell division protein ZapA [Pseudomonadota bacterium]
MAEVTLTIDAKQFRMACEDGQEDHLVKLAAHVDARVKMMRSSFGEIGDLRLTVMAALMVADEFFEEKRKNDELSEARASEADARAHASEDEEARDAAVAQAIDGLTARIERITRVLTPGN